MALPEDDPPCVFAPTKFPVLHQSTKELPGTCVVYRRQSQTITSE
jgi:hypothetical protein